MNDGERHRSLGMELMVTSRAELKGSNNLLCASQREEQKKGLFDKIWSFCNSSCGNVCEQTCGSR